MASQASGPRDMPVDSLESGNLGILKSRNLESQKVQNMIIIRTNICSAQNVGKVMIGRQLTAPFDQFFQWAGTKSKFTDSLPIFLGPIYTVWAILACSVL